MAQHLLDEGYHHAAASVSGAVLEDALRRHLASLEWKSSGNLESMNDVARDKSVYTPLVATQVKAWIAVRNAADHGEFDKVDHGQVALMVQGIGQFLTGTLGLP
ncbi:MAG: hypothetical protein ACYC0W_09735 [Candidatus Nanopelagicales bacterium]